MRFSIPRLPQRLHPLILPPLVAAGAAVALLVVGASLPPWLLRLWAEELPALALLRAYRTSWQVMMVTAAFLPLVYLVPTLWIEIRLVRRERDREAVRAFGFIAGLLFALVCFLTWIIVWAADYPALSERAEGDIRQIESGFLEQQTVLLGRRYAPEPMPGGDSGDKVLLRWPVIGPDTGWSWRTVYFPQALEFSPDPDRLHRDSRTIQWNLEHGQFYQLTYTTRFHLVVSAVPVDGPDA